MSDSDDDEIIEHQLKIVFVGELNVGKVHTLSSNHPINY